MAKRQHATQQPLAEELPRLLAERGLSMRALARELGTPDHAYLSRELRGKVPLNVRHIEHIAEVLNLPSDYFIEVRTQRILDAITENADFRDKVYALLIRERRARSK